MQKDLEFIKKVVKVWPENATKVRLDSDGEICFSGIGHWNDGFYPTELQEAKSCFVADHENGHLRVGKEYSKEEVVGWQEEWEIVKKQLEKVIMLKVEELNKGGHYVQDVKVDIEWVYDYNVLNDIKLNMEIV